MHILMYALKPTNVHVHFIYARKSTHVHAHSHICTEIYTFACTFHVCTETYTFASTFSYMHWTLNICMEIFHIYSKPYRFAYRFPYIHKTLDISRHPNHLHTNFRTFTKPYTFSSTLKYIHKTVQMYMHTLIYSQNPPHLHARLISSHNFTYLQCTFSFKILWSLHFFSLSYFSKFFNEFTEIYNSGLILIFQSHLLFSLHDLPLHRYYLYIYKNILLKTYTTRHIPMSSCN